MKKYFYLAAVSAMMLTACSSENDVVQPTPAQPTNPVAVQQQAVAFDTYLSGTTASTRAGDPEGVMTTEKLKTANKGFGVMAFYSNDNPYATSLTPNFMYNEHISWANGWTYSPLKYWPNETDNDSQTPPADAALDHIDKLSFFAYAPYVTTGASPLGTKSDVYMVATYSAPATPATYYDKAWSGSETSGIRSISAENRAGDPLVEWRYTNNPDKNVDLLWGVAPAGFSYTNVSGGTTSVPVGKPLLNLVKPDKDQKVKFLFQHALSRIGLSVVSAIDQIAAGDDAGVFNNAQTRVLIKNVQVFGDFGIQGVLNLNNTVANKAEWVAASIDKSDDADPAPLFWFDNGVAIGSAAPFNNVANSYIAPNLRYDQTQINAVTATAGSFAGVNTGVLPSEQPLLAGGADPGKKVKDPTFEYNKPYFTESAGTFTLATATAENADGFTYNSISDVYTQVQKTGGTPVTLNGYSAKHYKITATDAGSGTSVTDTKYYTLTGTVGSGDAVYTLALVGDGTTAIPASSYTLAPTALGATYATGDYYPAQPRYFMVIPTGNTPIKVKITYAVVTYDNKLTGYVSNVENDITKTVTVKLENGKSYNLKLILGLTSVKLDATVADWQVADETEVWLPQNNE